jgi:hypothetical protein
MIVEPQQLDQILNTLQQYMMIILIVGGVVAALSIAIAWIIFSKAGEPGWTCLVPIYNTIVFLRIVGRPWWHLLLIMFVPIYGWFIVPIIMQFQLAKVFGKGGGFGLGLWLLPIIFYPILAFGSSRYVGPDGRRDTGFHDDFDEPSERPRQRIPARRPIPEDSFEEDEPLAPPVPKKPSPIKAAAPKVKPAPPSTGDDKVLVQCSNCQKKLKVGAHMVGKKVKCPGCGTAFVA